MALQNESKMWFFYSNVELPILLKVISMCFQSFQCWKKFKKIIFNKTSTFCILLSIFTFFKKKSSEFAKSLTILSTVHMCLLLHELTASTSPPHLKHYSLNIKFLWTSFEKHSWSYFFYYLELELVLFFLYF